MEKGEPLFFGLRPVWSEAKEEWRERFLLLFHQGKESLDATRGPFFSLPMAAKNRTNGGRKKKNMKKDEGKELKGLRRQQGRRILLSFIQTIADQVQVGHPPCSFIPLILLSFIPPSSVIKRGSISFLVPLFWAQSTYVYKGERRPSAPFSFLSSFHVGYSLLPLSPLPPLFGKRRGKGDQRRSFRQRRTLK